MDETSTRKAKIGEPSKCAESGKTSMSRPPKMSGILEKVVNLMKNSLSERRAPKKLQTTQKRGLQGPIYRQKSKKNPFSDFGVHFRALGRNGRQTGDTHSQSAQRPDRPGRAACPVPRDSRRRPTNPHRIARPHVRVVGVRQPRAATWRRACHGRLSGLPHSHVHLPRLPAPPAWIAPGVPAH